MKLLLTEDINEDNDHDKDDDDVVGGKDVKTQTVRDHVQCLVNKGDNDVIHDDEHKAITIMTKKKDTPGLTPCCCLGNQVAVPPSTPSTSSPFAAHSAIQP